MSLTVRQSHTIVQPRASTYPRVCMRASMQREGRSSSARRQAATSDSIHERRADRVEIADRGLLTPPTGLSPRTQYMCGGRRLVCRGLVAHFAHEVRRPFCGWLRARLACFTLPRRSLALHSVTRLLPLHSTPLFCPLSRVLCADSMLVRRARHTQLRAAPTPTARRRIWLLASCCCHPIHARLVATIVCPSSVLVLLPIACVALLCWLQGVSLRLPEAADLQSALSKFIASNYSQDELKVRETSTHAAQCVCDKCAVREWQTRERCSLNSPLLDRCFSPLNCCLCCCCRLLRRGWLTARQLACAWSRPFLATLRIRITRLHWLHSTPTIGSSPA